MVIQISGSNKRRRNCDKQKRHNLHRRRNMVMVVVVMMMMMIMVCGREMNIRKTCKVLMVIIKVRESLGNLDGD